jgi:hypothetical protein
VRARGTLLQWLTKGFDYYLHKLPTGVLAEAETFRDELEEFERLAAAHGGATSHATDHRYWRFHAAAWADYLARRPAFPNYTAYLTRVHGDTPEALRALLPGYARAGDWSRVREVATGLLDRTAAETAEAVPWRYARADAALKLGDLAGAATDLDALAHERDPRWRHAIARLRHELGLQLSVGEAARRDGND